MVAVSTISYHRICGLVDFPEIHTVFGYFPEFSGFSAVLTISIHMTYSKYTSQIFYDDYIF